MCTDMNRVELFTTEKISKEILTGGKSDDNLARVFVIIIFWDGTARFSLINKLKSSIVLFIL